MYVIYFELNNELSSVYLRNIDLHKFLLFWDKSTPVTIDSFYGNIGTEYLYIEHISQVTDIGSLLAYIDEHTKFRINTLNFTCEDYKVEINDLIEFSTYADLALLQKLIDYSFKELLDIRNASNAKKILEAQCKYVVIDKGTMIDAFDSFDEYLDSGYD